VEAQVLLVVAEVLALRALQVHLVVLEPQVHQVHLAREVLLVVRGQQGPVVLQEVVALLAL